MSMLTARARTGMTSALAEIQAPVRSELERVSEEIWRIVADENPLVADVNRHLRAMKGKMFRPTLVLLARAATERAPRDASTLAAVVELIHLGTLVHDDSVDHSALRRGMPTVNSVFSHQVSVLMGDYLYTRALRECVRTGNVEALRVLTEAASDMTLGEIRQLGAVDRLGFSEDDYNTLIHAKTASLFSAACEVGALGADAAQRAGLARYGERLGMAFQVADDLLDYTEAQEVTGKPAGLDLRERKVTIPLIAALREMPAAARNRVEALFADDNPDDTQIADVVALVADHGGLEYARLKGEQFAEEAAEALGALPDTTARASLYDAIGYVMDRRW
jgi:octaprenyl-diphosphate synthase